MRAPSPERSVSGSASQPTSSPVSKLIAMSVVVIITESAEKAKRDKHPWIAERKLKSRQATPIMTMPNVHENKE